MDAIQLNKKRRAYVFALCARKVTAISTTSHERQVRLRLECTRYYVKNLLRMRPHCGHSFFSLVQLGRLAIHLRLEGAVQQIDDRDLFVRGVFEAVLHLQQHVFLVVALGLVLLVHEIKNL